MGRTLAARGNLRLMRSGGVGAGAAAIILLVGIVGPANAANPAAPVFDDGTAHPGFKYVPDVQPAWKLELVALQQQAKAGTMSAGDAVRYNAIIADKGLDPTGSLPDATASADGLVAPMAYAVSKSLTVTWSTQSKSWWCGPASAGAVIHAWHNHKNWSTVSAFDGQSLSQTALAGSNYTQAGTNPANHSATNWDEHDMTRALNNWLFNGSGPSYVQWSPDTVANLELKVTTDITLDWMIASDMYEKAAGPHYNHHPSKVIAHWTTIYGYTASGDSFKFQDPAADSPSLDASWDAVNQTFSMLSTDTFSFMTKQGVTRGIAW